MEFQGLRMKGLKHAQLIRFLDNFFFDFNKVLSLVVKHSSLQVLLVMVALFDLQLEQLDVKITFLHNKLNERIYMHQLGGLIAQVKKNHVCLLKKSLYDLKQSSRQWCKRFDIFMLGRSYFKSDYTCFVYFRKLSDDLFLYLLLYVNDILIALKTYLR